MPPFAIVHCTVDDGPALARNNMSAFWTDPTWVLIWRGKTLDYVVTQASRRMPQNLLTDTSQRRHQKAVDVNSGDVVGYMRWILPDTSTETPDDMWPAAKVPSVNVNRAREAKREFDAADWSWDHALDKLDEPLTKMKTQLMKQKKYLCESFLSEYLVLETRSKFWLCGNKISKDVPVVQCSDGTASIVADYRRSRLLSRSP